MNGIVLHCPSNNCRKLLMKEVILMPGTSFIFKCYYCGTMLKIKALNRSIEIENLDKEKPEDSFTIL